MKHICNSIKQLKLSWYKVIVRKLSRKGLHVSDTEKRLSSNFVNGLATVLYEYNHPLHINQLLGQELKYFYLEEVEDLVSIHEDILGVVKSGTGKDYLNNIKSVGFSFIEENIKRNILKYRDSMSKERKFLWIISLEKDEIVVKEAMRKVYWCCGLLGYSVNAERHFSRAANLGCVSSYIHLALIYEKSRDYTKARICYKKARFILETKGGNPFLLTLVLWQAARLHVVVEDYLSAVYVLQKLCSVYSQLLQYKKLEVVFKWLCELSAKMKEYKVIISSVEYLSAEYLKLASQETFTYIIPYLYNCLLHSGMYEQGEKVSRLVLRHTYKHDKLYVRDKVYLFFTLVIQSKSVEVYESCMEFLEDERFKDFVQKNSCCIHLLISKHYASQGNYKKALDNYGGLIKESDRLACKHLRTRIMMDKGILYTKLGYYQEAEMFLEVAHNMALELRNKKLQVLCDTTLAMLYRRCGKVFKERQYLERSLADSLNYNFHKEAISVSTHLNAWHKHYATKAKPQIPVMASNNV